MLFRTFVRVTGRHDLSNGSVRGTTRQRSGEHSASRQAFPNVFIYDTTTFRRAQRSPAVRHEAVYRARPMLLRTFSYTPTRRQSGDRRTPAVARGRRPGGQSPSPGGLPEPFGQARGFLGGHSALCPPSPLQYRNDTISGAFLSAIEIWSQACHENSAAQTGLTMCRRMWNFGRRHVRIVRTNRRHTS
jgi:hypothetical protein